MRSILASILVGIFFFATSHAQAVAPTFIVQWKDGHTTLETSTSEQNFRAEFLKVHAGEIKYFEADQTIRRSQPSATVAGPGLESWGQEMIHASSLWSEGILGAGVLIGVVDGVMDYNHPQLASRIAVNTVEMSGRAGVDDDGNGYVDDIYGWDFISRNENGPSDNSTSVAGILAAEPGKGRMLGLAPAAQMIPVSFLGANGGTVGNAVLGIKYAISRGARIINMSWGGAPNVQALHDVIQDHPEVLFVAAAGNSGVDLDFYPEFPAGFHFNNLITVTATTPSDMLASWSNVGAIAVHVGAPGSQIFSTGPRGGYLFMDGTSVSAPFVSGAAALLWSAKLTATPAQIKQALIDSADLRGYQIQSRGRLNVERALILLRSRTR